MTNTVPLLTYCPTTYCPNLATLTFSALLIVRVEFHSMNQVYHNGHHMVNLSIAEQSK